MLPPSETVEYVEVYSQSNERRRRLFRMLTWLLIVFLLLDVCIVVYIVARTRLAGARDTEEPSYTCRVVLRARSRRLSERLTVGQQQLLVRPQWAGGRILVLHDFHRHFTVLQMLHTRQCFIKHMDKRLRSAAASLDTRHIQLWAKDAHEVSDSNVRRVHFTIVRGRLTAAQLLAEYSDYAHRMCGEMATYRIVPLLAAARSACPQLKCPACPGGEYGSDENGCRTCDCLQAGRDPAPVSAAGRQRRGADSPQLQLVVDEGVLPVGDGAVQFVDVISG